MIVIICSIILMRNLENYSYKFSFILYTYNIVLQQIFFMANNPLKNYYTILGVSENASLFEIENAYEKLAAKWHPDKHKQHRKTAEARFQDINQAFEVLSDRNKRSHYDELLNRQYSLVDANKTFERFFNENDIRDEDEEKFFSKNYPNPMNNYYAILGVKKEDSLDDIKAVYRKLALKYHPKNNPNDEEAHKKFIEVNQAFNAISNQSRRENYDRIVFGEFAPLRAHNIFDDFFGNRLMALEDEEIRPLFRSKMTKDLDKLMIDEGDEKNMKDGQIVKSSSVFSNKNGKQSSKRVTTRRTFKNGKAQEELIEDVLLPTGERTIKRQINVDGKIDTKRYTLKKGEQLPKELQSEILMIK